MNNREQCRNCLRHPLLIKPNRLISDIRLSSVLSSCRRWIFPSASVHSNYSTIFIYCNQMAFSLTLSCDCLSGILLSDMCYHVCSPLLYPDWNSFAGQSLPSTGSPPASIDATSRSHRLCRYRYYGFFRLLAAHHFGFPIRLCRSYLYLFGWIQ